MKTDDTEETVEFDEACEALAELTQVGYYEYIDMAGLGIMFFCKAMDEGEPRLWHYVWLNN